MSIESKKIAILLTMTAFCLSMIVNALPSLATPMINTVSYHPSDSIWIGEHLTIQVDCTDDNVNNTITDVMVEIVGQNGYIIPNKTLESRGGGLYEVLIEALYMIEPNVFDVSVYCNNNASQQTIQNSGFTVLNFSADFLSPIPVSAFTGQQVEFNLNATKNDAAVLHDVNFEVFVDDGQVEAIIEPPYDPVKGWIVYINAPLSSGTYDLDILATHDRANDTLSTEMTVIEGVQFSILDVYPDLVEPADETTVDIRAIEGSSVIPLNAEDIGIKIESTEASINSISPVSDYYRLKVEVPNLSPGTYDLEVWITLDDYTYSDKEAIHYAIPISGDFLNINDEPIPAEIRFFHGGDEKLNLETSTDGKYSGKIQPSNYDIRFVFPEAVLELESVELTEFEDPLNYYYYTSGETVTGLKLAGLHVFETVLPFSEAVLEMEYDEGKVLDESKIKVYKCISWNSGKIECYGDWKEVSASIDAVKNVVIVEGNTLSAYAIGNIKGIETDFQYSEESYYLNDFIKIGGVTRDNDGQRVGNVSLRLRVSGTGIDLTTRSASNGDFLFEFFGPSEQGAYEILLDAEKAPYIHQNITDEIQVTKSKTFSIVFPETVQMKQGESNRYEIKLKNAGQTDLSDLSLSLTGIDERYFSMPTFLETLNVGDERKLDLVFSVPEDAELGTYSATLEVGDGELVEQKIFGFTVLSKVVENATTPSPTKPTGLFSRLIGYFSLPKIEVNTLYYVIAFFAVGSFALALMFRKKRIENSNRKTVRDEVRDNLFDLKGHAKSWGAKKPDGEADPALTWNRLKEKWLNGTGSSGDLDVGD